MKRALISTILLTRPPNPFQWLPISFSVSSKISQLHTNPRQITQSPAKGMRDFSRPIEFDQATVCGTLASFNNDYQQALDFFNWVESNCGFQHTTETYNKMIDVLGKFFEFHKSWELIRTMPRNQLSIPNHATFRVMFKRYAMAHMVKEAIETFYRLDEFNMKDETSFINLIDALCENKHVLEAEELCRKECAYVGMKTKIYNMILRGWLKLGWWGKCRVFWEEMEKMGVKKDLVSYSIYMDIQCKCKKPWKAVKLYKEMKKKGIQLDVVAYNTVVHAIGLSESVDFSIRLCKEMNELGCKPNVVTYNIIIKLLCENGRTKEAYEMLHHMGKKGCEPNAVTYACLFRSLVRPKEILRLFERMIESGVQPSLDTYVMLMRKFGRWGFLRPVFMVWKRMEELNCSPDAAAYTALIDALVEKGMLDMASKYDEEMVAKGLSAKPRKELLLESKMNDQSGDVNLL